MVRRSPRLSARRICNLSPVLIAADSSLNSTESSTLSRSKILSSSFATSAADLSLHRTWTPRRTSTKKKGHRDDRVTFIQTEVFDNSSLAAAAAFDGDLPNLDCAVTNKDIYGVVRKDCGECGLCERYMTPGPGYPGSSGGYAVLCLYCGCPPVYHRVLKAEEEGTFTLSAAANPVLRQRRHDRRIEVEEENVGRKSKRGKKEIRK
jgi:hypothetical protein